MPPLVCAALSNLGGCVPPLWLLPYLGMRCVG
jgi:hypothetical protein